MKQLDEDLWMALVTEDENQIKFYLHLGADVNTVNPDSTETPLIYAAAEGLTSIVSLLLKKGANPNLVDCCNWTALIWASGAGQLPIVKLLLAYGAAINKVCDEGSALTLAVAQGHQLVVQHLINEGADTNVRDCHGWSMLTYHARNNSINQLLIENGAKDDTT